MSQYETINTQQAQARLGVSRQRLHMLAKKHPGLWVRRDEWNSELIERLIIVRRIRSSAEKLVAEVIQ